MYSRCRIGHKLLKPLRRSGHSDNKRHNRETIFFTSFNKFLHDRLCFIFGLWGCKCSSMRFIDYNKKGLGLTLRSICNCFPNRIFAQIGFLREQLVRTELLCIQKIDAAGGKILCIKSRVNYPNVPCAKFFRFAFNFQTCLLIELRHIRKPNENRIRLRYSIGMAEDNIFK